MTGLIYTFTNKENGKEYVGQTIQPIEVRDYAHYYEAFNQNKGGKFNNALRKYGKGGGILGNLFGGNNNCCAMQAAENAKTLAMAQGQQKTQPILDEINREVGSLSLDEQKVLAQMPEYQMAKQTYEAGFMSFLGTKFSQEFVSSADGKVAADNLLATIRKSKEHIHAQLKAKEDKVNTLLELVEQDPEIKKRLDEVMLSKSK